MYEIYSKIHTESCLPHSRGQNKHDNSYIIGWIQENGRYLYNLSYRFLACCVKRQKKDRFLRSGPCSLTSKKLLDRSGEKPYCTFIICIRFHSVNTFFERFHFAIHKGLPYPIQLLVWHRKHPSVPRFESGYRRIGAGSSRSLRVCNGTHGPYLPISQSFPVLTDSSDLIGLEWYLKRRFCPK